MAGKNWVATIKNLLTEHGFEEEWRSQSCINLAELQKRICEREMAEWLKSAHNKPKLRTFMKINNERQLPKYLTSHISKAGRSLVAKLRFGTLGIALETGRYLGQSIANRQCLICKTGEVEDEIHLLFGCSEHLDLREDWQRATNLTVGSRPKIEYLREAFNKPYQLAKYVKSVMDNQTKLLKIQNNGLVVPDE